MHVKPVVNRNSVVTLGLGYVTVKVFDEVGEEYHP
jgi:hypothetical protein